jgi:hemerythrin-like domain-containing protein
MRLALAHGMGQLPRTPPPPLTPGHAATKALASLIREHQLVSRVLVALEVYAQRLRHGERVEAGDLGGFARVFRELADQIHHEKEESILLPLLCRHGLDWSSGVLPVVRLEHRQESSFIDALCRAAQRPPPWSKNERRQIAAAALALTQFQREHHEMENAELFPAVGLQLSEHVLGQLQAALEAFDADGHRQALRVELEALANELVERYTPAAGVARGASALAVFGTAQVDGD